MAAKRRESFGQVSSLRERISELEGQVVSYKRRLDKLRKAKNTTILKKETHVLEINEPKLGRRESQNSEEPSTDTQVNHTQCKQELEDLKQAHALELQNVKGEQAGSNQHDEVDCLHARISDLQSDNAALLVGNTELKKRVNDITQELSEKEALWCDHEEKLTAKIKMQWGERYQEWMAESDRKLEDLQQANNLMRTLLKNQKPQGRDPTGQDGSSKK